MGSITGVDDTKCLFSICFSFYSLLCIIPTSLYAGCSPILSALSEETSGVAGREREMATRRSESRPGSLWIAHGKVPEEEWGSSPRGNDDVVSPGWIATRGYSFCAWVDAGPRPCYHWPVLALCIRSPPCLGGACESDAVSCSGVELCCLKAWTWSMTVIRMGTVARRIAGRCFIGNSNGCFHEDLGRLHG
jgi:hypothetical protein